MLGGMLAGHDESGGELANVEGKHCKIFYGMSSSTAMSKYSGGVANYRASEGKTVFVSMSATHTHVCSLDMRTTMATYPFAFMFSFHYITAVSFLFLYKVPYKGSVSGTVQELLGGLRSSCTYVGAHALKELSKRTTFVR